MSTTATKRTAKAEELDVIIVGAGFAGFHLLDRLRGMGMSVQVFEAGDGPSGVWYWNCYPGARVRFMRSGRVVRTSASKYSRLISSAKSRRWSRWLPPSRTFSIITSRRCRRATPLCGLARYFHSVRLLQRVKEIDPEIFTKSGIMVGLGEQRHEVLQVRDDLRSADVDFLTLGQ